MASRNLLDATSNLPQVLVSAHVAATEASIYQCPGSSSVVVATATVCNTSTGDRTVELSVVKTSTTAGASNRVAIIELEAGDSCVVEELVGLLLGPGDFISGLAGASSAVSIVITGSVSS